MTKKILMLGSCKGSQELLYEAKKRNFYTIIADNCDLNSSKFKVIADERWIIDTSNIDELERKCRANNVSAIINGISTFNIEVTMELCNRLNLPCYASPAAWYYTIDKYAFKKLCINNNVPVAKTYEISDNPTKEELKSITYPVVVKAIDQSANRGMSYCYTQRDLMPAIKLAHSVSSKEKIIIEKKLEGIEYGAHYAITNGEASLICFVSMLSQPGKPGNCYSITTTVVDNLFKYKEEIDPFFKKALKNGGMNEGLAWIEMILDKDSHFYILEMGYRMSGDMLAIPIKHVTKFNSYSWLLDIATGIKHNKDDLPKDQSSLFDLTGCSYILWSDNLSGIIGKIEGIEGLANIPNLSITYDVNQGKAFKPYQYLVTFVFTANNPSLMCSYIEEINTKVKITDENGRNVVIYFNDYDSIMKMYENQIKSEKK